MVKKLFKHEINAYLRTIIPMHMVLIGIAILSRFVQLFDNNSVSYNIVFYSSIVAFGIGVVVCIILTFVFGIRRFYTNLFTSEGYLSFTLPVTPTQHIIVKNIVAVMSQISSIIMILVATCIITFGDVCIELFKAAGYLIKLVYQEWGQHTTLFILEIILALVVGISTTYMLFYACIALGQRAKKNRVAAAVGIFFIYYLIIQVIATICIIIVTTFPEQFDFYNIEKYILNHPVLSTHVILCSIIMISGLLNLLYFTITKRTITKKLNLE